jgi:hypothetical protein
MTSNLLFLAGLLGVFLLVGGALAVDFWIWRVQHPTAPAWSWLFHK